ncbi:hypothetical protein ATCV1_z522R [Acanthocystis turfacea chlorella virus 1]|uniref:Uncharacterized protein z522R n=1 Tax=Chlorovirus heliozoae TaxID=322019 RepID=A7K9D2_9PHYC|nr:hypothetical protein ATCV1_z522R [Acanthocystis turfacea chlorella virus 1]ABT16656.1 hypothetical protein ATCV1_z522R [Acanthocystis turfacea chlorella virus 1]
MMAVTMVIGAMAVMMVATTANRHRPHPDQRPHPNQHQRLRQGRRLRPSRCRVRNSRLCQTANAYATPTPRMASLGTGKTVFAITTRVLRGMKKQGSVLNQQHQSRRLVHLEEGARAADGRMRGGVCTHRTPPRGAKNGMNTVVASIWVFLPISTGRNLRTG